MPTPRQTERFRLSPAIGWLLLSLVIVGCAPRFDRSRDIVDRFQIHGVHQISQDDLQGRIATQERSRFFGVVLPWEEPSYYDDTTFRRDLDRIERYYDAHGFYSAAIERTAVTRDEHSHNVTIEMTVREGRPTTIATLWLSGCEPESGEPGDPWRASEHACQRIRDGMQLHVGSVFTEEAFDADRLLIQDLLRDEGHAAAVVHPQATVDPVLRRAHVVYVLEPGPLAHFGQLYVHEGQEAGAMRDGRMPVSHYPVAVAIRATRINPGDPYRRRALADAQRRLSDIGVFGIVRIDEEPHRCDSHNRCDAQADPSDPHEQVRVDLHFRLTPTRPYRLRAGGGAAIDQTRSDVHLSASFEHFRVPLFGRIGRYRIEESPRIYLPVALSGQSVTSFDVGNALSQEFRLPEVWPGVALVASLNWYIGPDPINPSVTNESAVRGAFGASWRFNHELVINASVRTTRFDYYNQVATLAIDPILRAQYLNQTYTYLEQSATWDGRDSPVQTRRGAYASLLVQESAAVAPFSSYSFIRAALDLRAYVPLSTNFILAMRGYAGAVAGFGDGLEGWPVPSEMRFYSGGANSNRGYAYNQVGWRTALPQLGGMPIQTQHNGDFRGPTNPDPYVVAWPPAPADNRFTNVGGLAVWEASVELRFYVPPFGLVAFFDSSDVSGWTPLCSNEPLSGQAQPQCVQPRPYNLRDPAMTAGSRVTPNAGGAHAPLFVSSGASGFGVIHPSAGIGFRYVSPVGVIRLDLGLRLDELGCIGNENAAVYQSQINQSNVDAGQAYPWYYAVSRPKCDFFGVPLPLAFSFAIGEAY